MNHIENQSCITEEHTMPVDSPAEDFVEAVYPLSPMQDGVLFHSLLMPSADVYFRQALYLLEGELDVSTFERAWRQVLHRHPILRTAFSWKGLARTFQVVFKDVDLRLEQEDWRRLDESQQQKKLDQYLEIDKERGFNLSEAPLWRLSLLRTSDRQHRFLLSFHHLLVDGWSIVLLLKEVKTYYEAYSRGVDLQLPPPRPYSDYISWIEQQDLTTAEAWWRMRLQGFTKATPLPFAGMTGPTAPLDHRMREARLSRRESEDLRTLARQHQLTMNTLLQGAWGLLLGRHSGESDVVFGTTVSGRNPEISGVESMVGVFINTLPIRVQFESQETVLGWLKRIQGEQAEAYHFDYTPLVEIQRWSGVEPGEPLFESLLVFENYSTDAFEERYGTAGLNGKPQGQGFLNVRMLGSLDMVNYPLMLLVAPGEELGLRVEYHANRLSGEEVERLLEQLRKILTSMASDPRQKVSEVSWMAEEERQQIVEEWNRTEVGIGERSVQEMFEEQAARTPSAVALECEGQRLTYAELNQRANQLGHFLRRCGVGPETRVALACERGLELIVGILGVLKAGGAYVPLDVSYPAERLAWMLDDSQAAILLTQARLISNLPAQWIQVFCLDSDWERIALESSANLEPTTTLENLAYLIYTSGSTGTPKGVAVEHQAIVRLALGRNWIDVRESDVFLLFSPVTFDASTFEIWVSLLNGARLIIFPAFTPSLEELGEFIARAGVTVLWLTAGLFHQMVESQLEQLASVRQLLTGGDVVSLAHVRSAARAWPGCVFINGYGPTENTTFTACHRCQGDPGPWESFPIGKPIDNTTIFVLNQELEPVPVGIPGELYVGGRGLSRGYFGRPALTAERFIPNPFSRDPGTRLYCTGDRVRWLPDGTLEYLGRRDHQVKVRGFRIELGEIESVLSKLSGVKQALVMVREDTPGDKRLVAYIVADDNSPGTNPQQLRAHLEERLPSYMLPAAILVLEKLPLTLNGKVDREALPTPEYGKLTSGPTVLNTPVEEILAGIWAEVLTVDAVAPEDSFFDLGGHSLLATQVISHTRTAFGIELPLRALFDSPTLAEFAGQVETRLGQRKEFPAIAAFPRENQIPLSFAQQRLWFIHQLEPDSAAYNMPFSISFRGQLDLSALHQSLSEIIRRHEALRTCFPADNGNPVQHINQSGRTELRFVDLAGVAENGTAAQELARNEAAQPFNLASGPLLRATLLRLAEQHHILLLTMHHIISDGWSLGVMVREFTSLYLAFAQNLPSSFPELSFQYADFALWQRQWLTGEVLNEQLNYWKEQLAELSPLELSSDCSRSDAHGHLASHLDWCLPEKLVRELQELSRKERATLFMTLLGAFQILLSRYSGQKDIAVGTPIAGRRWTETELLIGFFVNTLVLRTKLQAQQSFIELLGEVREATLGAYAHQDLPFEKLVEELRPERDTGRTPLFQVMMVLQNAPASAFELPGLTIEAQETATEIANFDLLLTMREAQGRILGGLTYRKNLFSEATMRQLLSHFENLLTAIVDDPQQPICRLRLLNHSEEKQLVEEWNRTEREYEGEGTVVRWFEEQVRETPGAVAVEYEGAELSYEELNRRANQVGHYLRSLGVGAEERVGLCAERSLEMVVGMLGVVKAGGAYVPLDPEYPEERLEYMMKESKLKAVLVQEKVREKVRGYGGKVVELDGDWGEISRYSEENVGGEVAGENLVYVIYTSGSTGKPKGVMNTHGGLRNRLQWMQQAYGLSVEDRVLQKTPYSFDVSVWEFFWPLLVGSRLVMMRNGDHRDPRQVADIIQRKGITTLHFVPSMLRAFLSSGEGGGCVSLRRIICSGEALGLEVARECKRCIGAELHNLYGPTEASIDVTFWECVNGADAVMIGKPIANTRVYALDTEMNPVGVGMVGELYLAGVGLARGYVERPELTGERFVPNPFSTRGGERLYRTGDRVRWRRDGEVEYLGRMDEQVKIRGNRIELGEIEAVLEGLKGVGRAVVVVKGEEEGGEKQLVAYVVRKVEVGEERQEGEWRREIREGMRKRLPEYMVPNVYVEIEELPLTGSGKLDRKQLSARVPDLAPSLDFQAPRDKIEADLKQLWTEVLGTQQISVTDNFFDVGGHSIRAVSLSVKISRVFNKDISPRLVFEKPTIEQQASSLKESIPLNIHASLVPIQRNGDQRPLFCIHPFFGLAYCYQQLSRLLGPDQPLYGLQSYGLEAGQEPLTKISDMAACYIQAVQSVQPHGPYQLAGWSMGAVIAYEMAQQLADMGETVSFLCLFDGRPPQPDVQLPSISSRVEWESWVARREEENLAYVTRHVSGVMEDESGGQESHRLMARYLAEFIHVPLDLSSEQINRISRIIASNQLALEFYKIRPYYGNATLFRVPAAPGEENSYGWSNWVRGELKVLEIPGVHDEFMSAPSVMAIAQELGEILCCESSLAAR